MERQKTFSLNDEEKPLFIQAGDSKLYAEINSALDGGLDHIGDGTIVTVPTLGKLKTPTIYVLNTTALDGEETRKKLYESLENIEGETLVLLDTFEEKIAAEVIETVLRARYSFDAFKEEEKAPFIFHAQTLPDSIIEKGEAYGEAINNARTLINTPNNHLNAEALAEYADKLSRYDHVSVKSYGPKDIKKMGMGAFLGVNAGSKDEPRLIHVDYDKAPDKEKIALIGKGIMFDTGGYSLKTVRGMPSMKADMGGAATVLGAIEAIARLGYEANISVIIAATDNRIGDNAHVPDDVLHSAAGKTIEIISTDAEGRLTLADAIWYAKENGADCIMDVATLTGAVVAALGEFHSGTFTNDDDFYGTLEETAGKTKEKIWRLPVDKAHHETLKSTVADMKNSGSRTAGASVAAAFLEKFVGETPWIHIDIAGTCFDSKKGARGTMVKTLAEYFA